LNLQWKAKCLASEAELVEAKAELQKTRDMLTESLLAVEAAEGRTTDLFLEFHQLEVAMVGKTKDYDDLLEKKEVVSNLLLNEELMRSSAQESVRRLESALAEQVTLFQLKEQELDRTKAVLREFCMADEEASARKRAARESMGVL
jgi:hypothetical protein